MNKCNRCGADIEPGKGFCSFCGARVDYEKTKSGGINIDKLFKFGKDFTRDFDPRDIVVNKFYAVLCYLGPLFLITMFAKKDSEFCAFHVNQGAILFILEAAFGLVINFFMWCVGYSGILCMLFSLAGSFVGLIAFIYSIIGISNCLSGRAVELPIIGEYRIVK